jgi:hypothetical protein
LQRLDYAKPIALLNMNFVLAVAAERGSTKTDPIAKL